MLKPKSQSLKNVSKSERRNIIQQRKDARKSLKESMQKADTLLQSDLSNERRIKIQNARDSMEQTLKDSYANKKGGYNVSTSRLENMANVARNLTDVGFDDSALRQNKMFERDVNQASIGGVSTRSKEEVKIFYAATKEIWSGKDITQRHKALMEHFGVSDLQEVWDIVFGEELVQDALKQARKNQEKISSSSDVQDGSTDEKDEQGSPDYIKDLIVNLDTARTKFRAKNE